MAAVLGFVAVMMFWSAVLTSCVGNRLTQTYPVEKVDSGPSEMMAYNLCAERGHVRGKAFANGSLGYNTVYVDYPDSTVKTWTPIGTRGYYCLRCGRAIHEGGEPVSITTWRK